MIVQGENLKVFKNTLLILFTLSIFSIIFLSGPSNSRLFVRTPEELSSEFKSKII